MQKPTTRRIRGSRTGRPVMALLDLLGRRWALRVVWELRGGPLTFRDLRARCGGVSPAVLAARLAELRGAAIVELGDAGYATTRRGAALLKALAPMNAWAEAWAKSA